MDIHRNYQNSKLVFIVSDEFGNVHTYSQTGHTENFTLLIIWISIRFFRSVVLLVRKSSVGYNYTDKQKDRHTEEVFTLLIISIFMELLEQQPIFLVVTEEFGNVQIYRQRVGHTEAFTLLIIWIFMWVFFVCFFRPTVLLVSREFGNVQIYRQTVRQGPFRY